MLIGWEEYNYFINCTAVQLMIFSKQTKWRKGILNTSVKWNCHGGTRWNTNKSTKFCLNKRTKWKYKLKHQILVKSLAGLGTRDVWKFAKLDSPRRLVQFWQNFQTSLVLLIPNCTRHRMITYTNYDNDRNYIDNYMSNHSYDNYIHLLVHSYEKMLWIQEACCKLKTIEKH
jgi:hypothetical protein